MTPLRAWLMLVWLSFRRLLWSSNALMALVPLAGCLLFLLKRRFGEHGFSEHQFDRFSGGFLIEIYLSIVVPLCTLAFAAGSIGGEREDRTLLFILVRPLARWAVLLAKVAATLPLALGITCGALFVFCALAGEVGQAAWSDYLPAVFLATLAYVGLFHLFAVAFRYSTIVALVYALLVEVLLGHAPGIIKRVAVNYYGRTLMYSAGEPDGLAPPDPHWFEPFSPIVAQWTLIGFFVVSLLIAALIFQRREYRDLT
jgi:ABC-2 type transport system permease protein